MQPASWPLTARPVLPAKRSLEVVHSIELPVGILEPVARHHTHPDRDGEQSPSRVRADTLKPKARSDRRTREEAESLRRLRYGLPTVSRGRSTGELNTRLETEYLV